MHRRSAPGAALLATLSWLLGWSCHGTAMAEDAGSWPTKAWETSLPEAQGMDSNALADLVKFGASEKMDSLLVTRHGRIVADAYYAPFRSGHRHRINSATKAVTGTLIAIALRDGLLDSLDRRVLEFFPDRSIAHLDDNKQAMTIRHLLNMTSGLEWKERLDDSVPETFLAMEQSPDWQQFILDQPMAQAPGTAFEYNSGNSHLLSAIVSRLTGGSTTANNRNSGPLGLDGSYRTGGRARFGVNAAKGSWQDEKTFVLDLQTLGNDDARQFTLSFEGPNVDLQFQNAFGWKARLQGTTRQTTEAKP